MGGSISEEQRLNSVFGGGVVARTLVPLWACKAIARKRGFEEVLMMAEVEEARQKLEADGGPGMA